MNEGKRKRTCDGGILKCGGVNVLTYSYNVSTCRKDRKITKHLLEFLLERSVCSSQLSDRVCAL